MWHSCFLVLSTLALSGELVAGRRGLLAPQDTPRSLPSAVKAMDDGRLTEGYYITSRFSYNTGTPSKTYCSMWDAASQQLVDDTASGPIMGSGPFQPPESEYASVAEQLCAAGAAGNDTISSAMRAGGDAARNVLAAMVWGSCSDPTAIRSAAQAYFSNSSELFNGDVVVPVARNFASAAEELGIAACVTIVTLDMSFKVADLETFSTDEVSGGLGPAPAPLPGPGDAPLPDGKVLYRLTWGPVSAQCMRYAPDSPTSFEDDPSAPAWQGTGTDRPDEQDISDFAQGMCDSTKSPGQDILDALEAGGKQAETAVAALTGNACATVAQRDAAFDDLFSKGVMNDPSTVLRYIRSFVDACDAIGTGCCFSVVVLDPSSNAVLDSRTIHTGGDDSSPPPAQPPPSLPPSTPFPPSGAAGFTLEQCKAQLGTASAGCTGSTIAPGSSCCTAVLGLGSECLAVLAQAATQPGADPVTQVAVFTLFTKCGVPLGGAPPTPSSGLPSPPAGLGCAGDPKQAFQAAVNACDLNNVTPGTACCNGLQALGGACLSQVLAASGGDASLAFLVKGVAGRCSIPLDGAAPPSASPAPPAPGGAPPAQLPDGITKLWWEVGYPAICITYSPSAGQFVNMTVPTYWNASGGSRPNTADTAPLIDQMCQGASAGDAFLQGVGEGGDTARAWVAAFFITNCTASYDAFDALSLQLRSKEPGEALGYVQKFVTALQELGIGACVTVTSLDSSGSVLGEVQVHTDVPASGPAPSRRRLHAQPLALPAVAQRRRHLRPRGLPRPA